MRAPEFWKSGTASAQTLAALLTPLAAAYDLAGRLRRTLQKPRAATVPVICVGNLVAGGAGKTPVVMALIALLKRRGVNAHVLIRGYGGTETGPLRIDPARHDVASVGDEALLLAKVAPTWLARDRPAGARAAAAAGAGVIVMDDGYQNPSLKKDLSLLVIDGAYGLGNGRVMPAGPLRENPEAGFARADAIIIVGRDDRNIRGQAPLTRPLLRADLVPDATATRFKGRRVFAFAGIGRPEKFFATLRDLGAELVETCAYPDHHFFGAQEVTRLLAGAKTLDAVPVTTAKDAARIAPSQRAQIEVLDVAVIWQNPDEIEALLSKVVSDVPAEN